MFILCHPFGTPKTRAKIYEMEETVDSFKLLDPKLTGCAPLAVFRLITQNRTYEGKDPPS